MKKNTYWKAVTQEYPGGVYCMTRADALYWTEEDRACGIKGSYVRKVSMTEEEFNEGIEI